MKSKLSLLIMLVLTIVSPLLAGAQTVQAASQPAGITISPFLQTVTVANFEATKQVKVKVTNHTNTKRIFAISLADFGSLNETGGIAFLGQNTSASGDHGLRNWLGLDQQNLTLNPNQSVTLTATVRNDASLAPGGHYGAVLVNEVTGSQSGAQARVSTNPTVSALLFVDKLGGERHDLHLDSLNYNAFWGQLPRSVVLRFQNPGTIEVIPRGMVRIWRSDGSLVSQGAINEDSGIALPGTYRQIAVPLHSIGSAGWWPQRYRLETSYRYDGTEQVATKNQRILAIPVGFLAILAGVVLAAVAGWLMRRRIARLFHRWV